MVQIATIVGSLRAGRNAAVMRFARETLPQGVTFAPVAIDEFPLYNENAPETPEMLAAKEVVRASDAVLIFMPEYNYSLPGPLKNAIDAMSRGEGGNCFKNKALGMISGGGPARGMKAQYHMRDISVFLDLHVMNKPELGINFFEAGVLEGEGAEMKLVHADHQRRVKEYVEALVAYTAKIKTAFA